MQLFTAEWLFPISAAPLRDGAIAVDGEKIVAVGLASELTRRFPKADRHEHRGFLMPGLVNAHAHLTQEPVPSKNGFVSWLVRVIEARRLKGEWPLERLATRLEESLAYGVTTVVDFSSDHGKGDGLPARGAIPNAGPARIPRRLHYAQVMGIGGATEQSDFDLAMAALDEGGSWIDGLGVFSPYTLSRNFLKIVAGRAKGKGLPVQIHAAESFSEMEFFYDSNGEIADILFPYLGWTVEPPPHHKTPIGYLAAIGFLETRPALVGCVHLGGGDLDLIARSGSKAIIVPRSELRLGNGVAPLADILAKGISVGIGTDGLASNEDLNLWRELSSAFELYGSGSRRPVKAASILYMATLGGACCLGLESRIGSLDVGKEADFILGRRPIDSDDPTTSLIAPSEPPQITDVFIGGERR